MKFINTKNNDVQLPHVKRTTKGKDDINNRETTGGTDVQTNADTKRPVSIKIVWRNVLFMVQLHIGALYGAYFLFFSSQFVSKIWTVLCAHLAALGITAGAHRLWTHRTYKARLPLRIVLAIWQTMAFQNDIIEWSRDHRVHHKYSETDADPHNAKRGFFFSHVGWLLMRKHPDVKEKGKTVDMSDLKADPLCRFQQRYYTQLLMLLCFIIPTAVPHLCWGESLWTAFFLNIFRLVYILHVTWLVNSLAHLWGNRPYDSGINPVENIIVSAAAVGEGFHNYHHTFPYDYSTSEHGWKLNLTTFFIDMMALIGQAYDRKTVSPEAILARKLRTGDKTNSFNLLTSNYRN